MKQNKFFSVTRTLTQLEYVENTKKFIFWVSRDFFVFFLFIFVRALVE